MATQAYYAANWEINAGTGDWAHSTPLQTWVEGPPMLHTVLLVLRTPKGRCLLNPKFGVDYRVAQKAVPNLAAAWRAAVLAALADYVANGQITDVSVTAEVSETTLVYSVTFTDPKIPGQRRLTTGDLSIPLG